MFNNIISIINMYFFVYIFSINKYKYILINNIKNRFFNLKIKLFIFYHYFLFFIEGFLLSNLILVKIGTISEIPSICGLSI